MSGIQPRRQNVIFDPLMNPGALTAPDTDSGSSSPVEDISQPLVKSSLALSREVPVADVLAKLSLKNGDEEDDPPAQSMSEFLGEAPGGSLFDAKEKSKKAKLFEDSDDDEDEATKERKAKRRAAAAAAAAESASPSAMGSTPSSEVVVPSARPVHLANATSAKRTAGEQDLFAGDEEDEAAAAERAQGLQGVYIPKGAAEYHTDETKHKVEQIDAKLLEEPDDADLEELGAYASTKSSTTNPAAGNMSSVAAAASSSLATVDGDLDDDLFSFTTKPTTTPTTAVDASAPDFDFNSYIKSQSSTTTDAAATKGASLFDDDDD